MITVRTSSGTEYTFPGSSHVDIRMDGALMIFDHPGAAANLLFAAPAGGWSEVQRTDAA